MYSSDPIFSKYAFTYMHTYREAQICMGKWLDASISNVISLDGGIL